MCGGIILCLEFFLADEYTFGMNKIFRKYFFLSFIVICGTVVNAPIFAKGKSEKIRPEQLNVRKETSKINNLVASDEVCCSLKVLQSDLIPFLRRKRRGIKPSARIKLSPSRSGRLP